MAKKTDNTEAVVKKVGIRPLMGYLLVEQVQAETKTASGLYLPETSQEKPAGIGVVLSTGPDLVDANGKIVPPPVKVGDKVVFKKWGGGDDVKYKGEEYKLVKYDDLMAVLED